jgi:hypothetical protein
MYMPSATMTTARGRRIHVLMLRWFATIQALAFVAFFVLAVTLVVGGDLGPDTVSVPATVLAHATTHPLIYPILTSMHIDYLVLGVTMLATVTLLWPLMLEGAPGLSVVALILTLLAGGLFIVAGCIGLPQPMEAAQLGLALEDSNIGAALYGLAVGALSAALGRSALLPKPAIRLGYIWAVVAILCVAVPTVGAVGPLLGAAWVLYLGIAVTGTGTRGRTRRMGAGAVSMGAPRAAE